MPVSRPPSILVIFADQLRGRDLGCMGSTDVLTPKIDLFAEQGVTMRRSYANTPVCTPNRGTLITGLLPHAHGALGNDLPLPPEVPGLGTVARAAGYSTGYIGKWHLDGLPREKFTPPGRRRHGFDYWAAYNCTHDYLNPRYYRDAPEVVRVDGYEPVVQTDLAVDFLSGLDDDQPFCLLLSWGPPHDPYAALPEKYRRQIDPDNVTLAPNIVAGDKNPLATHLETRRTLADYYAATGALDEQFGRLMLRLEALGRTDDTIVVFTSDHGDMLWAHGWMKKQLPHEESAHIPMLLRWPDGLPSGDQCDSVVGTVDLLPTLVAASGLDLLGPVQGRNFLPDLTGDRPVRTDDSVLLANHLVLDEAQKQGVPEWRALRTGRWTYAEVTASVPGEAGAPGSADEGQKADDRVDGREPWLLFDNANDPWQLTNLVADPAFDAVRSELRARLHSELAGVGDPFLSTEAMVDHFGLRDIWDQRVAWRTANPKL